MSKPKPLDERLAKIEKKISQLKAREQRIKAELNQQERKARTRRLIQIGAIFETGFEISSTAEAELLVRKLQDQAKELLKGSDPKISQVD